MTISEKDIGKVFGYKENVTKKLKYGVLTEIRKSNVNESFDIACVYNGKVELIFGKSELIELEQSKDHNIGDHVLIMRKSLEGDLFFISKTITEIRKDKIRITGYGGWWADDLIINVENYSNLQNLS
jgi:hypothetical protein